MLTFRFFTKMKQFNVNLVLIYLVRCCMSSTPNFILILTDDQDIKLDSLKAVPRTLKLIGNNGIFFENAFANSPICCPSRSSILTGKYAHNIHVVNNSISGNCSSRHWQNNFELNSIASLLKRNKNYINFYAGKYLNQYGSDDVGGVEHVPIGYDWWLGLQGNSRYYNYTLSLNGTGKTFHNEYLTDLIEKYAVEFLEINYNKPFFMTIAPPASHAPFTGAPRHLDKFLSEKAVRSPSFNYSSIKKHWIVGMPPEHLPTNVSRLDLIQRKRLQTLLSVDEMVENLINKLKNLKLLDSTYLIFTSDNGYHIGQFGQPWDKRQPYDTDIRVPFMMSGPKISKNAKLSHPISLVDIAPTILNLAEVPIPKDMDGQSFKTVLTEQFYFNNFILVEYWGEGNQYRNDQECPWRSNQLTECRVDSWCKCEDSRNNTYACVLHLTNSRYMKFCQFSDKLEFKEAYDLTKDPWELNNIYANLKEDELNFYNYALRKLKNCRGENCHELNQ